MSNQAYSSLKAAWHLDRIGQMRNGQSPPLHIHFIISDLCNHDCHFCSYRMSNGISSENFGEDTGNGFTMNPNRRIPTNKAMRLLRDFRMLGVKAVQFTGGGEPTVHKDHMDIFGFAQHLGLETSLVTNGSKLADGWRDVLPRMKWIRVSLDAGTPEVYSRVRSVKASEYDKVLSHCTELSGQIHLSGSDCLFGIGFVVTLENYETLPYAVRAAKDTGASYIRLGGMFSTAGSQYYDGHLDRINALIREVEEEYKGDDFKIVSLFGDRINDLDVGSPDYAFCGYQQLTVYIGADLKVYRCCSTSYTTHGEIGDLREQSFADWFRSQQKHDAYGDFDARSCNVCQFNDKNRTINYLLDREPVHVNFV